MRKTIKLTRLALLMSAYVVASSCSLSAWAQNVKFKLNDKGQLSYLAFPNSKIDTVAFNKDKLTGPALLLNGKELSMHGNGTLFKGMQDGLDYMMNYAVEKGSLRIKVTCKNVSENDMNEVQLSLRIGIDNCMPTYPEWRSIYFPTLLKCEKKHFWGYFMNPNGGILTISSPDPIASYHLLYNNATVNFASGHLIHSSTLDLLNPGPLPEENPQNCSNLKKGESRSWTIYLEGAEDLAQVKEIVTKHTQAPFIESPFYTVKDGDTFVVDIYAPSKPSVRLVSPGNKSRTVSVKSLGKNKYRAHYKPDEKEGVYKVYASAGKKTSQGWMSVRHSWGDYIQAARQASLDYPQKASSHTESWYGFFSAYIAKKYFPNAVVDEQVEKKFQELYPLMYNTETLLPFTYHRIQNHALMASLLAKRYQAGKNEKDLFAAAALADFLLSKQSSDGAYRNGRTHYTSVIYIAKSIMEVMEAEKELTSTSAYWASTYRRHYASVKRAMDELAKSLDNIQTEGQNTFEDGMIRCSYTQLAMFALLQPEGSSERAKYLKAAEYLVDSHRCLSQLMIPDSRVHGASIRFWESQYDILIYPNFVNSPHGWSAWRIYGLKYLYLLTGNERYLADMMNGMGSCAQLLNPKTGVLNWAFVSDPYVKVKYFIEDVQRKGKGVHVDKVIGRQYLPMISNWYRAPENTLVSGYGRYDGGCCDNDVHEIFKCVGEVALTSAYFHVRTDGTFINWNCSVKKEDGKWVVIPDENTITTLYTNNKPIVQSPMDIIQVGSN